MRFIAEFIMQGRLQACLVAFLGIPLISQCAAGLVTLKNGFGEGVNISLAYIAPVAIVFAVFGAGALTLVIPQLVSAVCVLVGAMLLKKYRSWPLAIMSVALISISVMLVASGTLDLRGQTQALFDQLSEKRLPTGEMASEVIAERKDTALSSEGEAKHLTTPDDVTEQNDKTLDSLPSNARLAGFLANMTAILSMIVLLISRWWQALLFNPGGFRDEFHGMRLSARVVLSCVALFALLYGVDRGILAQVALFPLFFAGLGLVHWYLFQLGWGLPSVVGFYVCLIIFPPVPIAVVVISALDAVLNLRKRRI